MAMRAYISSPRPSIQQGQAVSEFLGILAVLMPLLLFVPVLGKFADMNHAAVQASRYGAWERTIASNEAKSETQLTTEVRRRFFSRPDVFIKTNDGVQESPAYHNPLWSDHAGRRLLARFDNVTNGTANAETPGTAATLVRNTTTQLLGLVDVFSTEGDFDLDSRGLYTSRVSVAVAALPINGFAQGADCANQQSGATFTCIQRHNVILADTWNSGSPDHVAERVRGLVPMGIFAQVTGLLGALSSIPFLRELDRFDPGYVSPDVIAGDRLGTYQP